MQASRAAWLAPFHQLLHTRAMNSVFFFEAFAEEAECIRSFLPDGVTAAFTEKTIQEFGAAEPPAGIISVRTQSIIPPAWAAQVDGILARTTGYDHMQAYRREAGDVICGHLPLYCARAVAEQAMMLWMALGRRLPQQQRQFETFNRDGLTGRECLAKNLLVVGVGNIGHEVVGIGRGLGMHVKGVDIVEKHADVEYAAFEQGLAEADILVCAMNRTADNRSYFNYETLKGCKPGLIFVNVSRGECSPAAGLVRLIDQGLLSGVGLDVYNNESDLAVHARGGAVEIDPETAAVRQLAEHSNVILTPHNSFNTEEAVERKSEQSIDSIVAFLDTGAFKWPVPV